MKADFQGNSQALEIFSARFQLNFYDTRIRIEFSVYFSFSLLFISFHFLLLPKLICVYKRKEVPSSCFVFFFASVYALRCSTLFTIYFRNLYNFKFILAFTILWFFFLSFHMFFLLLLLLFSHFILHLLALLVRYPFFLLFR